MAQVPIDIVVVGTALNTHGFTANKTIAGIGLDTLGFLWTCDGIWTPCDDPSLVTTWVAASVPVLSTEVCIDG